MTVEGDLGMTVEGDVGMTVERDVGMAVEAWNGDSWLDKACGRPVIPGSRPVIPSEARNLGFGGRAIDSSGDLGMTVEGDVGMTVGDAGSATRLSA